MMVDAQDPIAEIRTHLLAVPWPEPPRFAVKVSALQEFLIARSLPAHSATRRDAQRAYGIAQDRSHRGNPRHQDCAASVSRAHELPAGVHTQR